MPDDPEPSPDPEDELDPGPTPGDAPGDPEPPSDDPTDPPDEPEDPAEKNWKSLQDKYPGKTDAEIHDIVNAAYWEQTKELSAHAKRERESEVEKARLEGRLEGAGTPPGEPPPEDDDFSDYPDIQEVDSHITGLTQRGEEIAQEQSELLKELNEKTTNAAESRGELAAAKRHEDTIDGAEVARLEAKIERATDRVASIRRELNGTVRAAKDLREQHARVEKEKTWLVRIAKEGKAKAEKDQQEAEEALEKIPTQVDGQITASMKALKVPKELQESCRKITKDQTTVDFWRIGTTVPFGDVDVPRLVKNHVEHFLKANGIASKSTFAERSKQKNDLAGDDPPKGKDPKKTVREPSTVSAVGDLPPGMLRARRMLAKVGW